MKPVLIFGAAEIAEVAHFYFTRDTSIPVAGFTVDAAYLKESRFCGLPVVPFEEAHTAFAPGAHDLFVALSYAKINAVRAQKCAEGKARGYRLASYVSSKASVWDGFQAGENCFILEDNTIQPFVRIGNNVTLWSGNHIGHHSTIHDHCFISSHVVVSGGVDIGEACFIGVNATLRDHIRIGEKCVIGAGALILADASPEGVYIGPATERSRVPSSRLRKI
jgi:sugar O-acyltransferase (sialic acid O-acetyltransferase NeuD family)